MAEPISVASGLVTLTSFALKASKSLYHVVESFQTNQRTTRELKKELEALDKVLQSLQQAAMDYEAELAGLKLPLLQCGKTCSEFEKLIDKCMLNSDRSRTSFRDWTRLSCVSDGISRFKLMLAGYKTTINIALGGATCQAATITSKVLEEYNKIIANTTSDLKEHLYGIDSKSEAFALQDAGLLNEDAGKLQQVQDERDCAQQCLQTCQDISEHIEKAQISMSSGVFTISSPCRLKMEGEDAVSSSMPQHATGSALNECIETLAAAFSKLKSQFEKLDHSIEAFGSQKATCAEDRAKWEKFQKEKQSLQQGVSVCTQAVEQAEGVPMSEDEEEEEPEEEAEWYPGDGICPSTLQFNSVRNASYATWCLAATRQSDDNIFEPSYIDAFLGLLEDVPAFYRNPPMDVDLIGRRKSPLTLRSFLRLDTTDDPSCNNPQKDIPYVQCLGFPEPMTYKVARGPLDSSAASIGMSLGRARSLTSIALAWSYVLSCRWVEILQDAGEHSSLCIQQSQPAAMNFWDLAVQSRWSAQVKRSKGTFYAPWMLREESFENRNMEMVQVPPNSLAAYDNLVEFCLSEDLMNECAMALITVLMITSIHVPPPTLPAPVMISRPITLSRPRDGRAERLYRSIDQCMALSSTRDGLDSLICSVFFDPGVPCNLVGAASTGIREAVLQSNDNYRRLITSIANRHPQLVLPWVAVVCSCQATTFLTMTLERLPPICLVAAFWTKTRQSFLQIMYTSPGTTTATEALIPRPYEFSTSYYCRPDASVPWSPARPFGSTSNFHLSLDIRKHYSHQHTPLRWRTYWILRSGDSVPSSSQVLVEPSPGYSLWDAQALVSPKYSDQHIPTDKQRIADDQSGSATSRLFNWHRANDDGLWLDDGTFQDVKVVRKLQQHPWIADPFGDSGGSEPCDEEKDTHMDQTAIMEWIAKV